MMHGANTKNDETAWNNIPNL